MFTTLSLDEAQKCWVTGFHGCGKITFLKEQMFVKQGLKRKETIENGYSQKALEYPLSTDVCAISDNTVSVKDVEEAVERNWRAQENY